jgi:CubicO group peptidase (beta-lactamase class C family)
MRFLIRVSWLLVFSIGYSQIVSAQGNPDKIPAAVDEVFADVTKPGSPGCTVATARDGKMLYAKGYGLANIEQNVALTPESVFDIGSTSKQFSAASILLLEEQGKLSVNDDVRKFPSFPTTARKSRS